MWVVFALVSAALLGFYDVFKKESLKDNAVIPVLTLNCLICSLIFIPFIIASDLSFIDEGSMFYVRSYPFKTHLWVILKAVIVLSSWICGFFGIKHLPLTIAGPINATRPVITLIGAMIVFGERLNGIQWIGVLIAISAFFLLSKSGKKEGIDFKHNNWIFLIVGGAVLGAISGLYDKFLLSPDKGLGLDNLFVQSWYNIYQTIIMFVILATVWLPEKRKASGTGKKSMTSFSWKWSIPLISLCLSAADLVYMYALTIPGAMIAIVSMIRRCSVLVSFGFGAVLFKEKNLKAKGLDLALVLLSLIFLLVGTMYK